MNLDRLMRISTALCTEKDPESAIRSVALNVCQTGSPAIIYISRITKDLTFEHFLSFGVRENARRATEIIDSLLIPIFNHAITTDEILFQTLDRTFLDKFPNIQFDKRPAWKTVVVFSVHNQFLVTLTLQVETDSVASQREYFSLVSLLLGIYLTSLGNNSHHKLNASRDRQELLGKPLTTRQSQILELIRAGLTNVTIAAQLGYSESLIKQETIVIYQKLGIEGRKEIVHSEY